MFRPVLLIATLATGIMASAETPTSPASTPVAEEVTAAHITPEGVSFFSPKTESDVSHMATVHDEDFQFDLSDE